MYAYGSFKIDSNMLMKIKNSRSWPEGHYESGDVCDLEIFLELSHWVFFKLRMVLGAHVGLCVREPNFLQKSFPWAKITKNGQK